MANLEAAISASTRDLLKELSIAISASTLDLLNLEAAISASILDRLSSDSRYKGAYGDTYEG